MSKNNIIMDIVLRRSNQRKNAQKLIINTPNSIVEKRFIKIGGIDQWITVRGEDLNNPVLFFIHGGPASTYSIFSPLLRSWEKHFTIVQWDQRGSGKTFRKNGKAGNGTITFDRLTQDGIEITEYLLNYLGQEKLILIGSSVGSIIATKMVKCRPELFHAYVGTDQNVSPDGQILSYQMTLDALHAAGHKKGVQVLKKIGPDPSRWSRKDFDQRNQWTVKAITTVPNMIMDIILPSMLSSPDHRIREIIDIFKGMNFSLNLLFDELLTSDVRKLGLRFELPVFIFQGDTDLVTPTAIAKEFLDEIDAPHKEFVLIKNAGHLAVFAQPDQFLDELNMRVRPMTLTSS
ncbi:alpha/beta fold hydrolase [Bacillus rhizoplanae]|uniref:alpha/beta fold hydrolase n=1 Tax=Bacillus rhizoplanae TaxID=2880966 RepID=UPI003D1C97C6